VSSGAASSPSNTIPPDERGRERGGTVIYCVVPGALADDLYEKLVGYYADDPNVTVIVDRRKAERRTRGSDGGGMRQLRDRRQRPLADRRPRVDGA
jgi:hypothetical protein